MPFTKSITVSTTPPSGLVVGFVGVVLFVVVVVVEGCVCGLLEGFWVSVEVLAVGFAVCCWPGELEAACCEPVLAGPAAAGAALAAGWAVTPGATPRTASSRTYVA